jgi:hypothetical protein
MGDHLVRTRSRCWTNLCMKWRSAGPAKRSHLSGRYVATYFPSLSPSLSFYFHPLFPSILSFLSICLRLYREAKLNEPYPKYQTGQNPQLGQHVFYLLLTPECISQPPLLANVNKSMKSNHPHYGSTRQNTQLPRTDIYTLHI